jgi:Type II CAAX prenyl endopeptidase Rce1-like
VADAAPAGGLPGGPRLKLWLFVLAGAGALSFGFGLQEAALLVALSGLFVAAQAADLYPDQRLLYWAVTWVVPVSGALVFGLFTWMISQQDPTPLQTAVAALSAASAVGCLATMFRPVSNLLSRALFRREPPSHALRLSARLVLMGILLAIPGWYVFRDSLEQLLANSESLIDRAFFGSGLVGYVLLAFAAVGFMVRRDLKGTLERLGIRALKPVEWVWVPVGLLALFGLNAGLEAFQHAWLPDLWARDQRVSQLIAGELGVGQILMLGLSAGIGEEITLRGALQPRLGLFTTSLLFAALHIQYSLFGMGVIFLLGLLLGTIRNRTCTTVAMIVHALYDIAAVFSV